MLTAGRFRVYLEPFMGHMMMERVKGEDVGADRLWLERRVAVLPGVRARKDPI